MTVRRLPRFRGEDVRTGFLPSRRHRRLQRRRGLEESRITVLILSERTTLRLGGDLMSSVKEGDGVEEAQGDSWCCPCSTEWSRGRFDGRERGLWQGIGQSPICAIGIIMTMGNHDNQCC
ncbi:hypothetical protein EUGRSUZ_H01808 [Eucalyptus grandis]|uniref:Uncharacterized protein n=2 Tax=Eucalyptus grandis TaxID=71139 RepID=A0ACC3JSY7_EUCGR|nr:hypothetical protein EUGRSUZ_H01808 [Eucalyptus grandis]